MHQSSFLQKFEIKRVFLQEALYTLFVLSAMASHIDCSEFSICITTSLNDIVSPTLFVKAFH